MLITLNRYAVAPRLEQKHGYFLHITEGASYIEQICRTAGAPHIEQIPLGSHIELIPVCSCSSHEKYLQVLLL